ncbi:MAG: hypothetical protein HN742_36625 [Lentisphaerae bacterium]|jgi:hypothetical protein|nr:hypothetical protein [Lentisphaerota bacterium]MBT4816724.1 hypothetical protein [Lentisphaerota bacterium]MBT7060231.1 hypothetical protein [Lentisphaerota bacterium]MBT7847451.1 hypothetical protein [Lentisphaerota bacterium]
MQSVYNKIHNRIKGSGRGSVFTNKDFLDLGARASVDVALASLVHDGVLRRVTRGIYDYPQASALLGGVLAPAPDKVAKAVARKSSARIQPNGAWAANMLGLSTQVPAKIVYLTDNRNRDISIGRTVIQFRRSEKLLPGSELTVLLICALRHLGKTGTREADLESLRGRLSAKNRTTILREARYAEGWVYETLRRLCRPEEGEANG